MKQTISLLLISTLLFLTACGSSSADFEALQSENSDLKAAQVTLQQEKESLQASLTATESTAQDLQKQVDDANSQISSLQADLAKTQSELQTAQADLKSVSDEYAAYKEQMSPYEGLSEAEAEARQIEADRIKAEEAAEQERKAEEERLAAEEAAREAEEKEKLGYETGITYEQLARNPDDYKGQKVKFTGEVVQVIEGDGETDIRLAVHWNSYGWYDSDQIIYCGFDPSILSFRLLEDDIITIYGYSLGLYSYEAVSGATITLPCVWVEKIELQE